MAFNFAWIKEHKAAVAGIVLGALVIIYLARSKSGGSGGGGVYDVLASQQQGQLQMAQLNAQLSAQGNQTQAQLEAERISANAQTQHDQDQAASTIALYGLQGHLYEENLHSQDEELKALMPSIQKIINVNPKSLEGHQGVQQTLIDELELLLSRGQAQPPSVITGQSQQTGFGISIPGFGSLGVHF